MLNLERHYSGSMSVRIYNSILVAVTSLVKLNIHFQTIKQGITPVLSIFKSELNFGLNVLPEFEVLTEFNGSLNVNINFKYCLVPKWE